MKKLTTVALALALSVSLAACNKATGTTGTTSSTTPAASTSSSSSSSSMPSDTTSGSATGDSTTAATPVAVDQSTPEAAMTSWLGSMVAGDGKTVCELMATGGKTITSIPGAAAACGKTITPMLDQLKELSGAFSGLKISGATVTGDKATFESVTTEPALAADVVSNFKAVRIGGKWYVTQG
jgi:hypothetical protein